MRKSIFMAVAIVAAACLGSCGNNSGGSAADAKNDSIMEENEYKRRQTERRRLD